MAPDKKNKEAKEENEKASKEKPPKESVKNAQKSGGSSCLNWTSAIAVIGVTVALVITVHKLNTQIATEKKLHAKQIQEFEAEASSARTKETVAESAKLDALSKVKELENQVKEGKESLQKAEVELATMRETMKANQEVMEAAAHDYGELERKSDLEIKQLKADVTKFENDNQEKDKTIQQLQVSLTEMQQSTQQKGEVEAQLGQQMSQLQTRIEELQNQVQQSERIMAERQDLMNAKDVKISEMDANLNTAHGEINSLREAVASRDASVLDIQAKWQEAVNTASHLQEELTKIQAASTQPVQADAQAPQEQTQPKAQAVPAQ